MTKHGWFSQEAIAARKGQRAVLRVLKVAPRQVQSVIRSGSERVMPPCEVRLRQIGAISTVSQARFVAGLFLLVRGSFG
jgi:hypothetical protein